MNSQGLGFGAMSPPLNKVNTSPPSKSKTPPHNRTRSNSNSASSSSAVQHDQIAINSAAKAKPAHHSHSSHSSASYKQELMDSSVLLDNVNEILHAWDAQQDSAHSLEPL